MITEFQDKSLKVSIAGFSKIDSASVLPMVQGVGHTRMQSYRGRRAPVSTPPKNILFSRYSIHSCALWFT